MIMEYVIKIRGRESRIRTIPSLVAVLPDKKPMAGGGLEASGFGKAVPMEFGKEDIKHPLSKGKRFQKGGWLFVEPRSQVRKAAAARSWFCAPPLSSPSSGPTGVFARPLTMFSCLR